MSEKVYLGDAVYYEHDGYAVLLTTENGVAVTNRVYLEQEVLINFLRALMVDYKPEALRAVLTKE